MTGEVKRARSVAALYDIHGNAPALAAVLAELRELGPELVVIGGDVTWGPLPRESMQLLREFDAAPLAWVRGNCDREQLGAPRDEQWNEVTAWCSAQLGDDDRRFLGSRAQTVLVEVAGVGEVLFCHATPRSDEETFTELTPADLVEPMFAGAAGLIAVCGHTHIQGERTVGGRRIVNAGSVGMPYELATGAYWLWLGPKIEHRRTDYDTLAAAALIDATDFPIAGFTAENVLQVPDPQQSAQALEAVARSRRG